MEGRKRKKSSKNKKRNWRKNTDVKDVQEFIQERSREQVTGLPAADKSNEQLFYVEKHVSNDDHLIPTRKVKKPLRSELSLYPNSAVPGFPARKRRKVTRTQPQTNQSDASRVSEPVGDSSSDDDLEKSVSYQQVHAKEKNKLATKMKEHPSKTNVYVAVKDLWNEIEKPPEMPDEHYQKVTRRKTIKRPPSLSVRPSALSSIDLPHAGMSYNPAFEDHQELLGMAVKIEEERARAADKLEKKLQLAKLTHTQREQVWLEEMTEGLLSDGGDGNHGNEEGEDSVLKRPVRAEDRKTKKQRRKERLRREMEKLKNFEKAKKVKMDEIFRLRSIKKEIASKERAASEKERIRIEAEKMAPYQTHRLGKHLYEEQNIDVQLSTEITGSLRSLKPEGSLAVDRYKSLQKRNIIEPRHLVRRHRKYKLLVKEKRSCKIPEELPTPG